MDKNPRTPKAPPPFIPVTGLELTERWSVSWQAIFDLARQGILTPCEPEPDALKRRIKDDFGMISSVYSEDERGEYFSLWLYHPADCNRFEETFPEILEAWQQKYNSLKATHPQEPTDEEWITTHQVCELLGKKPFQILELMQIGKLQAFNSHGRQILPTGSIPTEYNGLRRLEQSLKTEGGRQAFWRPRKGMQDTKHPTEPYELFDCHLPIDPGEADKTLAELDRFLFRKSDVDAYEAHVEKRRAEPEAPTRSARSILARNEAERLRKESPEMDIRAASRVVSQFLAKHDFGGYSNRQFDRIVKDLGFPPGKRGNPRKK